MTKTTPDGNTEQVTNQGGKFTEAAAILIRSAKPGDTYLFTKVKAKCPGDPAGRKVNSLVFEIK